MVVPSEAMLKGREFSPLITMSSDGARSPPDVVGIDPLVIDIQDPHASHNAIRTRHYIYSRCPSCKALRPLKLRLCTLSPP